MAVYIDREKCTNCRTCYERCPEESFGLDTEGKVFVKYPDECWLCGSCQMDCPVNAIKVIYDVNARPVFLERTETGSVRTEPGKLDQNPAVPGQA